MSTVAEQLHQAREARKLSIEQVAEVTKIRTDHLRALEEGNFDVFAAPVYIRGFVRSYSTLLKMDVPLTMKALEAELGQTQKFAEPPPLSEHPQGVLDFAMLQLSRLALHKKVIAFGAVVILAAALLGYTFWRHHPPADPTKGLKPGVYQSSQGAPGETLALPAPKH
jgi:cytoskeletal protein RodZ